MLLHEKIGLVLGYLGARRMEVSQVYLLVIESGEERRNEYFLQYDLSLDEDESFVHIASDEGQHIGSTTL
jgi:hypothetical protein